VSRRDSPPATQDALSTGTDAVVEPTRREYEDSLAQDTAGPGESDSPGPGGEGFVGRDPNRRLSLGRT
jgi:hypothetical protein